MCPFINNLVCITKQIVNTDIYNSVQMWISIYDNKFYFREIGHVPETVVRFGSLLLSIRLERNILIINSFKILGFSSNMSLVNKIHILLVESWHENILRFLYLSSQFDRKQLFKPNWHDDILLLSIPLHRMNGNMLSLLWPVRVK